MKRMVFFSIVAFINTSLWLVPPSNAFSIKEIPPIGIDTKSWQLIIDEALGYNFDFERERDKIFNSDPRAILKTEQVIYEVSMYKDLYKAFIKMESEAKLLTNLITKGVGALTPSKNPTLKLLPDFYNIFFNKRTEDRIALYQWELQKKAKEVIWAYVDQMRANGYTITQATDFTREEIETLQGEIEKSIMKSSLSRQLEPEVLAVLNNYLIREILLTAVQGDLSSRKRDAALYQKYLQISDNQVDLINKYEQICSEVSNYGQKASSFNKAVEDLANISNLFLSYENRIGEQLADFTKIQNEILEDLLSMNKRIAENEENIARLDENSIRAQFLIKVNQENIRFIKLYLYSNMSAKDQLTALAQGWFPPEITKDLRLRAELLKKREELWNTFNSIIGTVSLGTTIAYEFGVDPNIVNNINKTLNVASVGGKIAWDVLNDIFDPLQWIGGIVSLFTGNASARRHRQVMKALGLLADGQEQILKSVQSVAQGIEVLSKNQQIIIDNQQRILDGQKIIVDNQIKLSKQIYDFAKYTNSRFDELINRNDKLSDKLEEIHEDVYYTIALVRMLGESFINSCDVFISSMSNDQQMRTSTVSAVAPQSIYKHLSYPDNTFANYNEMNQHYTYNSNHANICFTSLERFLLVSDQTHNLFHLKAYRQKSDGIHDRIMRSFDIAVKIFREMREKYNFANDLMNSFLLNPSTTTDELELKYYLLIRDQLSDLEVTLYDADPNVNLLVQIKDRDMNEILNPEVVAKIAVLVLKLHHYYHFTDNPGSSNILKSLEDVIRSRRVNNRGRDLLKKVYKIVNIAIAQQILLSGEYLLPILAESQRLRLANPYCPLLDSSGWDNFVREWMKYDIAYLIDEDITSFHQNLKNGRLGRAISWEERFLSNHPDISKYMLNDGYSMISLLKNPSLAYNYMNFLISNRMTNGFCLTQEVLTHLDQSACKVKNRHLSNVGTSILPNNWFYKFEFQINNEIIILNVPMPTIQQIGKPIYNPVIYELIMLRESILESISRYEIVDRMQNDADIAKVINVSLGLNGRYH